MASFVVGDTSSRTAPCINHIDLIIRWTFKATCERNACSVR